MPNMTRVFNQLYHDLYPCKEKKFMKCIRLFACGDGLRLIFKNQIVEAECTMPTICVNGEFYKRGSFVEASLLDMVKYYNKKRKKENK